MEVVVSEARARRKMLSTTNSMFMVELSKHGYVHVRINPTNYREDAAYLYSALEIVLEICRKYERVRFELYSRISFVIFIRLIKQHGNGKIKNIVVDAKAPDYDSIEANHPLGPYEPVMEFYPQSNLNRKVIVTFVYGHGGMETSCALYTDPLSDESNDRGLNALELPFDGDVDDKQFVIGTRVTAEDHYQASLFPLRFPFSRKKYKFILKRHLAEAKVKTKTGIVDYCIEGSWEHVLTVLYAIFELHEEMPSHGMFNLKVWLPSLSPSVWAVIQQMVRRNLVWGLSFGWATSDERQKFEFRWLFLIGSKLNTLYLHCGADVGRRGEIHNLFSIIADEDCNVKQFGIRDSTRDSNYMGLMRIYLEQFSAKLDVFYIHFNCGLNEQLRMDCIAMIELIKWFKQANRAFSFIVHGRNPFNLEFRDIYASMIPLLDEVDREDFTSKKVNEAAWHACTETHGRVYGELAKRRLLVSYPTPPIDFCYLLPSKANRSILFHVILRLMYICEQTRNEREVNSTRSDASFVEGWKRYVFSKVFIIGRNNPPEILSEVSSEVIRSSLQLLMEYSKYQNEREKQTLSNMEWKDELLNESIQAYVATGGVGDVNGDDTLNHAKTPVSAKDLGYGFESVGGKGFYESLS